MNAMMNANYNTACYASAADTEASFSCMKRACDNSIMIILDAIIVASIIICTLVLGTSLLILVLVLLAVLLLNQFLHKPKMRTTD